MADNTPRYKQPNIRINPKSEYTKDLVLFITVIHNQLKIHNCLTESTSETITGTYASAFLRAITSLLIFSDFLFLFSLTIWLKPSDNRGDSGLSSSSHTKLFHRTAKALLLIILQSRCAIHCLGINHFYLE